MDEADPAADAGLGAQALLGLAAGNNVRLPSLANLSEPLHHRLHTDANPHSLLGRAAPASGTQQPLFPEHSSAAPLDSRLHLHHQREQAQSGLLSRDPPQEDMPAHANANRPTPRLPPVPSGEMGDRKERIHASSSETSGGANPPVAIPRLASISEWAPSGAPPLLGSVPSLPRLHHPLQLHGVPSLPSASLSLPAPQRQGELPSTHSWAGPSIHTLLPQFPAPPPVRQEWPSPAPLVYSYPPAHVPAVQSDVASYYYGANSSSHYVHHAPQLPQLHPQPAPLHIPQYVGVNSSEPSSLLRSSLSPRLDQRRDSFSRGQSISNSLPPIVSGVRKDSSDESAPHRSHDVAPELLSVVRRESEVPQLPKFSVSSNTGDASRNKPARKSVFAGPASGRGLVDLMNPTDTLASVAAAVEPLPAEEVRILSPLPTEKAASALAHQIFGTGTEVLRTRIGQTSPRRRRKSGEKKESVMANGPSQTLSNSLVSPSADDDFKPVSSVKGSKSRYNANDSSTPEWEEHIAARGNRKATSMKRVANKTQRGGEEYESSKVYQSKSEASSSDRDLTPVQNDSDDGVESDNSTDSEITRCPCGSAADSGTMIACDQCNTWQHRICMGFRRKSDVPRMYYCHICRPEEMRPNCVAHPKFKERQMAKDKDEQCEPILLSVKPLELRKLFSADLKAKQNGTRPLCLPELFLRYATLYRTQFGKDRQSVLEGLVVLTEIPRAEVKDRLESAIRKSKMAKASNVEAADSSNAERGDKRRQHHSGPGAAHASSSNISNGIPSQSRSSGHKRSRPSPVSPEIRFESEPSRHNNVPTSPVREMTAREAARMSREERKVRQVMNLFARLEERERDRKRPRLGEPSGSPRVPAISSPKPNGLNNSSRPAFSPKSPTRTLRLSQSPEPSRVRSSISPAAENHKQSHSEKPASALPSPRPQPSHPPTPNLTTAKRERSSKDRKESRRREARATSVPTSSDVGRRNGILPRRKERQVLSSASMRQRKNGKSETGAQKKQTDPDLKFHVRIPGPSVLGSRLVPRSRRSDLDNEAEDEERKEMQSRDLGTSKRLNKKSWLLEGGPKRPDLCMSPRPVLYPFRKRVFRYSVAVWADDNQAIPELSLPSIATPVSPKKEILGVSMVVVSKREELPDGGKGLEKFLAAEVVPVEDPVLPAVFVEPYEGKDFAVKKRRRLRGVDNQVSSFNKTVGSSADLSPAAQDVEKRSRSRSCSPRPPALRSMPFRSAPIPTEALTLSTSGKGGQLHGAKTALKPVGGAFKKRILHEVRLRKVIAPLPIVKSEPSTVAVKTEKSPVGSEAPTSSSPPSKVSSPVLKPKNEVAAKKEVVAQPPLSKPTAQLLQTSGVAGSMPRTAKTPPPSVPSTAFVAASTARKARSPPPSLPTTAFVAGATARNTRSSPPPVPSPAFVSGSVSRNMRASPPPVPSTAFVAGSARKTRTSPPPLPAAVFSRESTMRPANPVENHAKNAVGNAVPRNTRTPPPPLRRAVFPRDTVARPADHGQPLSKTGISSVMPRNTQTPPPPLRSAVIPRETGIRSADPAQAAPKSGIPNPIHRNMRTPPPLRSVPRPAATVPAKTNGVFPPGHMVSPRLRSVPNGRNMNLSIDIPVTEETTASDILHLRLQGFLHQSSSSNDPTSPRSSRHPGHSSSSLNSLKRTPNPSPRSKASTPLSKYPGNGMSNSWRSLDKMGAAKRVHGPAGASLTPSPPTSARLSSKPSHDRSAMRNLGNKLPLANGKSPHASMDEKSSTTPWRSYRQQNGWAQKAPSAPAKHPPYSSSSVAPSASQDKNSKNNGNNGARRRPYS